MRTALFPGSFDPVTNGHIDVIERACSLFDKIHVTIAINGEKNPMFSLEERESLLKEVCFSFKNVEVGTFDGLLIDAAKKFEVAAVIRGLRAISDFEYEFQMAMMNRTLSERCETVFLMPKPAYSFLSSRMIKEIAMFGGDVSHFVPPPVAAALERKRAEEP